MKYLVLILVVVVVLWLVRSQRPAAPRRSATPPPPQDLGKPREMVECRQCGVHLPRDEALPGPGGHYCCEAHRRASGG
ncbi:PP0621 family protein [Aquabacterium sp. A7-Y]|uniref:PP0621 family protein n=1 Tax=Aquabacterium sp. A7-Y TaxID=1349605 RepID=UPI00223CFA51|nr:PP0621 family protein [Aquabacterium sp. A7-Y]MCW7537468.1 PP0621 family protein [Aquabacterium sp. A7-Y]